MIIELKDVKIGHYVYWHRKGYKTYLIGIVTDLLPHNHCLYAKLIEAEEGSIDKQYIGGTLNFPKNESIFFDSLEQLNKFMIFS